MTRRQKYRQVASWGPRGWLAAGECTPPIEESQVKTDKKTEEPYPRGLLDRAADAEFAHARLERRALHAQDAGSAFGTSDAPLGLAESAQDVLALGVFKRGNRGRRGSQGCQRGRRRRGVCARLG